MKFVVSDLDGTLLQSNRLISEYTKVTIKKLIDSGINFVIATGRGRNGVLEILKQLEINKIFLICNNGANIYNEDGEQIFEKVIDATIGKNILKEIRKKGFYYSGFRGGNYYRAKEDLERSQAYRKYEFKENVLESEDSCPDTNKIIVTNNNVEGLAKLKEILKDKFGELVEITLSQPTCIDITPKECTKGNGIKRLSEIYKISPGNIMAFGDGENDLDMLRVVGHPVIMGNSQEILKCEFKNITLKNDEDGVAKYLKEYFKL